MADRNTRQTPAGGTQTTAGSLEGRTILLLPYTHLDWAWCFSRDWHHARYVAIFDEALRLADTDPRFCLFIDSLAEAFEPYLAARPEAREQWNRLVRQGRVAVVGGQYVNLRPSTAPEELFIRNLEVGRRVLMRLLPAARPCGYANLDTAIGHSQLPQLLSLAGFTYMMVGRSEAGLQQDGVPAVFEWASPAGAAILVLVQHYGVCTGPLFRLDNADPSVRAKALTELKQRLQAQAELPLDTMYAIVGADDTRYLHEGMDDRPCDTHRIIRTWNAAEPACLQLATPDVLVRRLQPQIRRLQCRTGPVDQGDVAYNGPFGQSGLRELRDRTAAALIEAEVYDSLAHALSPTVRARRTSLRTAWRQALRAQTHATQYLFEPDIEAIRLDLSLALQTAVKARETALERLAPRCLPQDSPLVALFNPLPQPRTGLVAVPVTRTDFGVKAWTVEDAAGRPLPQQEMAPPNVHRPGEWHLLVRAELPGAGCRTVRLRPEHQAPERRRPEPVPLRGTLEAGACRLTWEDGHLVRLEAPSGVLTGAGDTSLLEPFCRPVRVRGWLTTALDAPAARVCVTSLRQTEWGPLRWCVERTLAVGPHCLRQWFHVLGSGRLEITTDVAYGPADCFFSLALPCGSSPVMSASVPFGVEPRHASAPQGDGPPAAAPIERLIPGLFYARDWVRLEAPGPARALVVLEGDRYWLCRSAEARLEHLLLRATAPVMDGWEQFTQINRPGFMRFRHVLALGSDCTPERLSAIADEGRFPVRTRPVPDRSVPGLSLARLDGAGVRVLSWRRIGAETELRLVESAGTATCAALRLQGTVSGARLVDLRGRRLPETVTVAPGPELRVDLLPWQIRTLRYRWSPGPQPKTPVSPR